MNERKFHFYYGTVFQWFMIHSMSSGVKIAEIIARMREKGTVIRVCRKFSKKVKKRPLLLLRLPLDGRMKIYLTLVCTMKYIIRILMMLSRVPSIWCSVMYKKYQFLRLLVVICNYEILYVIPCLRQLIRVFHK